MESLRKQQKFCTRSNTTRSDTQVATFEINSMLSDLVGKPYSPMLGTSHGPVAIKRVQSSPKRWQHIFRLYLKQVDAHRLRILLDAAFTSHCALKFLTLKESVKLQEAISIRKAKQV